MHENIIVDDFLDLRSEISVMYCVHIRFGPSVILILDSIDFTSNFRLAVNKKGAATKARKPAGKGKAAKDPNKPKRPPSAFFVFM